MRRSLIVLLSLYCIRSLAQTSTAPLPPAVAIPVSPQTHSVVQEIIGDTLVNGQAYEYDRQLADGIGPRLTGSHNYLTAVGWAEAKFKEFGLTNVHREYFSTDTWEPEAGAKGVIVAPTHHALHLWSYGDSPSTPSQGIEGKVTFLPTLTPTAMHAEAMNITGRIIVLDRASFPQPFTLKGFINALNMLEELHPAAVLMGGDKDGTEDMGALRFDGKLSSFPVAQIGAEDVSLMRRLVSQGTVTVRFHFSNRTAKSVRVPQLIAEIRGSEKPDEIVIIGAHLDSWQSGTGAQDNGTGVATVVDAAREISRLGRAPKRTIRFILFGGEEQGLIGSNAYVKEHQEELAKIDAVLITDTGGEVSHGWYVMGRTDEEAALANVSPMLAGLGSAGLSRRTNLIFETDHAPFNVNGVPSLVLWTDTTKYSTLHHKASDTFDSVDQASLTQGVATVIATAYAIADSEAAFAVHASSSEVQKMLREVNQWEDYETLRRSGMLP